MDNAISKVCEAQGITPEQLFAKNRKTRWRTARLMLWVYLVRDMRYSYAEIAKRFGCTRRNVVWCVTSLEGDMSVCRASREAYRAFLKKAGLEQSPSPLGYR